MNAKRFLTLLTALLILISFLAVSAYAKLLSDSEGWENITDKEASALLTSTKNDKDTSFIIVYYRNSCGYSKTCVPQFEEYAKENGITLSGIDESDYPRWTDWTRYSSNFVIGFPMVIAYNHENDKLYTKDSVRSLDAFKNILTAVDYPTSPVVKEEEPEENITETSDEPEILFDDVDTENKHYKAIKSLVKKGILTGYDDNTFKPDNTINRTEAATVIVRAADLAVNITARSTYDDVSNNFWGTPYIMTATKAGIINGMGDNLFNPTGNVTHNQIIKMAVCMMGLDGDVAENGGWPDGYLLAAKENGIIDNSKYRKLLDGEGTDNATRAEVASYIYSALAVNDSKTVYIGKNKYYLGMSEDELDEPDEVLSSTSSYTWYVYGTKTYKDFVAAGVDDNGKVVAIASAGKGFTYMDYKAGDLNEENLNVLKTDKNDGDRIHALFISESGLKNGTNIKKATLADESKMNFHFTNAFRVLHGVTPLKWCDDAATAARLHSEDMADQNYFTHDSLDGTKFSKRLSNQGIRWATCGENIHAGTAYGFGAYCGWVNSAGHRNNMLNRAYEYLGVGAGYNSGSDYKVYFTQDFYA